MQSVQYSHVEFTATEEGGGGLRRRRRKRNLCINTRSTFNHKKIWPSHVWACLLTLQL
jgi:hypothetical protein